MLPIGLFDPVLVLAIAALIAPQQSDSVMTRVISPEGGAIELPGIVRVEFDSGTFASPQAITIKLSDYPSTSGGRWNYHLVGGGPWPDSAGSNDSIEPLPVPYDVTITGDTMPTRPFRIILNVPQSYLATVPPGFTPRAFAYFESGGALETHFYYDAIPSSFEPETRRLIAEAYGPDHAWYRQSRFHVQLLIGSRRD